MNNPEREMFERKDYYCSLLSFYGSLLPKMTYQRMSQFYLDDLSITEIAQNQNVSRNAVFESIKIGEKRLDEYEKMLGLRRKKSEEIEFVNDILAADTVQKKDELLNKWKGELENGI